eukprot:scaffold32132_cov48-Prasinocladus_malaysianus.AAC.1
MSSCVASHGITDAASMAIPRIRLGFPATNSKQNVPQLMQTYIFPGLCVCCSNGWHACSMVLTDTGMHACIFSLVHD